MQKQTNKKILSNIIKNIDDESKIEEVKKNPEKYYSLVDNYGISNKLNKIIDDFEEGNPAQIELYEKLDLNIGIICDEFLYYSLKDAANFIYIPYEEKLEINQEIDLFLVVTSWRGLDHSWDYVANPKGNKRYKLIELIRMYREEGIPTVFYSKEDPVSYNEYLSLAKECDFIFTSAHESIEKYKRDTQNHNVDHLEFGVNPMYHNPVGKDLTDKYLKKQVTFAGSWMKRFPERNQEALKMFEGVNKTNFELCIIDRQYERQMERYHYPPFLLKQISATIPHERLMKLHKATMWGLNLNSVKNSNTMFANRVYELQAMGNVVISNYNVGVHKKFPNIVLVNSRRDVEDVLKGTTFKEQKRLIANGLRKVMLNQTSYHRLAKIANAIGIDYQIKRPKILVVGSGENSKESYNKQMYMNLDYIDQKNFNGDNINLTNYTFISFFSDNIDYGEHYIENLLSTFAYTNADVVYMNKDKFNYTDKNEFIKSTSMVKSTSYSANHKLDGLKYFNIPRTEIKKIEKKEFDDEKTKVLTAIIPINDDYEYLEDKIISSLNKYKINESLDVILIDTKKPDSKEQAVIRRLLQSYSFIKYFEAKNEDDNLSKVKNRAIEHIKTKFVVFLNAQNQVSSYNFKSMLEKLKVNNEVDIILGKISELSNSNFIDSNFDDILKKYYELNESIDSVIINKSFLERKNILFDESLDDDQEIFTLNVLYQAKNIIEMNKAVYNNFIHDYYPEKFSADYKLNNECIIESKKKKIIEDIELAEYYGNQIFPIQYLNNYLDYFNDKSIDKVKGFINLRYLFELYKPYYKNVNNDFNQIIKLMFGYDINKTE